MQAITYWRNNKHWSDMLGKKGRVIASTYIRVSSPALAAFTPYSFAIVSFGHDKKELMGVPGEQLAIGDEVVCLLRKADVPNDHEVIAYTIKVKKTFC